MTHRDRLQRRTTRAWRRYAPPQAVVSTTFLVICLIAIVLAGCAGAPTAEVPTTVTMTVGSADDGRGEDEGPPGAAGTRRDPIPLGRTAQVGDWKVRVTGAMLDATQAVLDQNMFNKTPAQGSRYVLVAIEGTYMGKDSSTFWIDIKYTFVGEEGDTFGMASAVAPDSIMKRGEVVNGGSVSGNLVFLVPSRQVAGATLMLEEIFVWELGRVFFALE